MNEKQYKDWVKALPELSAAQAQDVSNRLKVLSFAALREFTGKQLFGDRITQAICSVFTQKGVEHPSVHSLRKSQAYASSKDKFLDLAAFFEKISESRLVQDAILREAIGLLYQDMLQWQGVTISSHTILQHIHRLPATLNRHFPGYASSGLLHKIVKVTNDSA